jgi:proteasome accessory factor C
MVGCVAKDTEKLIRQLSLIAYLMAERRPVTATEIRRDVEGYSDMTEDAFARRFYADRAELDSLGIHLSVDRPADGFSEQENYSLAPEAFFLPAIEFSDAELAALQTALSLLDGEFAYASRCGWRSSSSHGGARARSTRPCSGRSGSGITGSAGGAELSRGWPRSIPRSTGRKRIEFEYFTMQSGDTALRKVDPYELLFEGGQFYLVGWSHERGAIRVFRSRDPRQGGVRDQGGARLPAPGGLRPAGVRQPHPVAARRRARHGGGLGLRPDRLACRAQLRPLRELTDADDGGQIFRTPYAIARLLLAWVSATSSTRACSARPRSQTSCTSPSTRVAELHRGEPPVSVDQGRCPRRSTSSAGWWGPGVRQRETDRHPPRAHRAGS